MLEPVPRPSKQQKRHRSPSYLRRLERRKAARLAAETSSCRDDAVKASQTQNAEKYEEVLKEVAYEVNIETEEVRSYKCDPCDFSSKNESGLRIHVLRKHRTIEQLDGNVDYDSDETDDGADADEHLQEDCEQSECCRALKCCGGDYCMEQNCIICLHWIVKKSRFAKNN